jgi:hypothetical protein
MTRTEEHGYVVDDGATDVLAEEIVHVPAGVAELVEAVQHHGETFVADVPDWDKPDP